MFDCALQPRRCSLDAAWTTQPLLTQVDCLRSALSYSSIGTSVASGGGSPTQQHSPTSSNGSVWSSGGSPGYRLTSQERTPQLQQATSSPPLKDYLPLSPQAASAFAAAAAAGVDGSGCGAAAARFGPIGGEMRGRHDSGVCVRHSPTELLGAEQQPQAHAHLEQRFDSLGLRSLRTSALLLPSFGAQPGAPWSAQ